MTRMGACGLLAAVALAAATAARGDDDVGLFFYRQPVTAAQAGAWVQAMAPGASVSSVEQDRVTRLTVRWPDVTLILFIDPAWPRERQLQGIHGWLGNLPAAARREPKVKAFLAELGKVSASWGSRIAPGFDAEGKVVRLLLALVKEPGGFFFSSAQAFYGADGAFVAGRSSAPARLGPQLR